MAAGVLAMVINSQGIDLLWQVGHGFQQRMILTTCVFLVQRNDLE